MSTTIENSSINTSNTVIDSGSIFSMWQSVDSELMSCMMILLIVFRMSLDIILGYIEKQLSHHTHYMKILSQVYRQLMELINIIYINDY